MAGTDTIRGIGYQQALAVHLALDLLDSGDGGALRVEGMDDIVDIETLSASGQRVSAVQAKTRTGSPWPPGQVTDVFSKWLAGTDDDAQFTFVTNHPLGPGAQKFADALDLARAGSEQPLISIVGAANASRLRNSFVRVAPDSVGSLLAHADRRAAAFMDPLMRNNAPSEAAQQAVNALFRVLTERAGNADPDQRIVSSSELQGIVGGLASQAADARWPGELHRLHRDAIAARSSDLVELALRRGADARDVPAGALLDAGTSVLTGPTGSGKSSIASIVQHDAAARGRIVIVGRAETYLAGRLDGFAADALGLAINRALPPSTGRQILADPHVTLIIDGASEIPDATAMALAVDLEPLLSRAGSAAIILIGRSAVAVRRLLPRGTMPSSFTTRALRADEQRNIADRVIGRQLGAHARDRLLQQAEARLGDGATNPFLLTIFLESGAGNASRGVNRSAIYGAFLDQLAARSGEVAFGLVIAVLAQVFAELIAKQRRYSDAYEWVQLTDRVASSHPAIGITGSHVRDAALQSGVVNQLGYSGTVAPFHDSIADYLASLAFTRKMIPAPTHLFASDGQWVLFAAEQDATAAAEVAPTVVRDIPFTAVALCAYDKVRMSTAQLALCTTPLLCTLLGETVSVAVTELDDGRRKARVSTDTAAVIVESDDGPLRVAVRLWRLAIRRQLRVPGSAVTPRPGDPEAARAAVDSVARQRKNVLRDLLRGFPSHQQQALREAVGPLGTHAEVGAPVENMGFNDWALSYLAASTVRVVVTLAPRNPAGAGTWSTVLNYCSHGGNHLARVALTNAVEALTDEKGWLA